MIKITNLNKFFNKGRKNEFHVINNTSLEFGNTGLVCILGESGSGKTTLLNTIGGLDTFSGGSIQVDDVELKKYSPRLIARLRNRKYGYIFQNYYLLMEYSVDYNIRLALKILDVPKDEMESRIVYVLSAVDMLKYRKKLVSELSGGQQQRVAIARALAKAPEIIFADEPTGNLDEANTMRIMSIIRKVADSCLVILVTHEKRIADFFADRIIVVKDGTIVKDRKNESNGTYVKSDDTNLYLKEYQHNQLEEEGFSMDVYGNPDPARQQPVRITIVQEHGRLYIRPEEGVQIVLLDQDSETELVDDYRPEIGMEDVEQFEYEVKPVGVKKSPNLSLREVLAMAHKNVRLMGKKQIFMIAAFIATALLLTVAVADYYTVVTKEPRSYITDDSRLVTIAATRTQSSLSAQDYSAGYEKALKSYFAKEPDAVMFCVPGDYLNVKLNSVSQLANMYFRYTGFGFMDVKYLNSNTLIAGKMPDAPREIALDEELVKNICDANPLLSNAIRKPEDMIGQEVYLGEGNTVFMKVTGIVRTHQVSMYGDKYDMFTLASGGISLGSLDSLKAKDSTYKKVDLSGGQVLLSDYYTLNFIDEEIRNNLKALGVKVKDTFKNILGYDVVADEEGYSLMLWNLALQQKNVKIYTENPEGILAFFKAYNKTLTKDAGMKMVVSSTYQDEITQFHSDLEKKVRARELTAFAALGISLFILFFTMKANAIRRTQELVVYRLMGISNKSIGLAYILEVVLFTSYTQLPAMLFVSTVMKYLSGIRGLGFNTSFSWPVLLLLLAGVYLMNILVGLIPVLGILRQPPARLALKS